TRRRRGARQVGRGVQRGAERALQGRLYHANVRRPGERHPCRPARAVGGDLHRRESALSVPRPQGAPAAPAAQDAAGALSPHRRQIALAPIVGPWRSICGRTADMGPKSSATAKPAVQVGGAQLTIENVVDVAAGRSCVALSPDPGFRARIERGAQFLQHTLDGGNSVYGVTTGYGDSCVVEIPGPLVAELPAHLVRYHGCGTGPLFD